MVAEQLGGGGATVAWAGPQPRPLGGLSEPARVGYQEPTAQVQRARILDATVLVVREQGYSGASITSVSAAAGVSRRTFYETFEGLEDCFLAVLDHGYWQARMLISEAFEQEGRWQDGVREALAALLSFFDGEPALAYVLLVEAAAAGPRARERRERHIVSLTSLIEEHWGESEEPRSHPLRSAGVMASLLGVLHTHMVTGREEPLLALLGSLMGLVAAPYLDRRQVAHEIACAETMARELLTCAERSQPNHRRPGAVELPDFLRNPRAHRARACLLYLAEHPGASNRQVAEMVGIARHTHISTLLARLAGAGLLYKATRSPGRANAWSLTSHGVRVAQALKLSTRAK